MSVKFSMTRDINGFNGFGLKPATDIFGVQLAESTAQSFTIPSNHSKWLAIFSIDPGLRIFVSTTTTAAVPTGTVASIPSELNPTALELNAGAQVSMITPDTSAFVTVKLYVL